MPPKNPRGIALTAALLLPVVAIVLSACTPPLPPDVLAAQAEANITCQTGSVDVSSPEIFKGALDAVGQSLTSTCADQKVVEVDAGKPAPVALVDVLPSAEVLAKFKTTSCPVGKVRVTPAFTYPVSLAFNEPGIEGIRLTPQAVAGILNGTIKAWNDPLITASNDGLNLDGLPPITLMGLSQDQGSMQAMTAWLTQVAPKDWTAGIVAKVPAAKPYPNVTKLVDAMTNTEGAIAVLPMSTATNNVLGAASLPAGPDLSLWIAPDDVQLAKVGSAAITDQTSTLGDAATDSLMYGPGLGGVPVDGQYNLAASKIVLAQDQPLIGWPVMGVAHLLICDAPGKPMPLSFAQYAVRLAGQGSFEAFGVTPLPENVRVKTFEPLGVTAGANAPTDQAS